MNTPANNLERMYERIDSLALTVNQRSSLSHYLLGATSLSVDPDVWDAAVERGIRFAAPLAPVEVSS